MHDLLIMEFMSSSAVDLAVQLFVNSSCVLILGCVLHSLTQVRFPLFNPLLWLAGNLIRETRETLCDRFCAEVLGDRQQYTDCLLRVVNSLVRAVSMPVCVPVARTPKIGRRWHVISSTSGLRKCLTSRYMRFSLFLAAMLVSWLLGAGVVGETKAARSRIDHFGDPLPQGAIARLGSERWRHGGIVQQLKYSADGKRLASWDSEGTLRVWETATGRLLSRNAFNQ